MFVMMEVFRAGRPTILKEYPTFDDAFTELKARPDFVFGEADADNPGCADAFLSDGRLIVIEPAARRAQHP